MKKYILLLILAIIAFRGNSQDAMIFGSLEVLPKNPHPGDSVKIAYSIGMSTIHQKIASHIEIVGDSIKIISCFEDDLLTQSIIFKDTAIIGLLDTGTYHVRILGYISNNEDSCTYDYNEYRDTSFQVTWTTGGSRNAISANLAVFPNPGTSTQTLSLTLQESQPVNLALYDLSGREVKQVYSGVANAGENRFELDLSQLQRGVYFCKLFKEGRTEVVKVIKQ